MGPPCPPCKRLKRANLELLPGVNNLLTGGDRGTHESLRAGNTQCFRSSDISLDVKSAVGAQAPGM